MNNQQNQRKIIKVVQAGDYKIGKTTLYHRYIQGIFVDPILTLCCDFYMKDLEIDGQQVRFQFWDYHSNERFNQLSALYYKGCQVLMISYDITNRQSFEQAFNYYRDYNLKRGNNVATLFLVGNKCDLEEKRQVSYEEGKYLSESLGMIFMEVSAKEDYQVTELFEKVIYNGFNIY